MDPAESMTWSMQTFGVREALVSDLPMVVKVTSGCYGIKEEDTIDQGQVLMFTTRGQQKCVKARHEADDQCHLSIPLNYNHKFTVINYATSPKRKKAPGCTQTLAEILDIAQLPLTVRFDDASEKSFTVDDRLRSTKEFGDIMLLELHDVEYIRANPVNEDMLHTRNNIYIPMYRDIRYCIANADNISTKALVRMAKAEESQEPQEATLSIVGYEDLDYVDELYDTSDNVFSKGPEASIGGNSPNARPVGASHDANSETTPSTRRPRRRSENIGSDFVKTLEQTLNFRMSSSGSVPGTGSVDHAQKAASSCRSPPRSSSLKYMFSEPEPVTSVRETSKQRSASPRSKGARRGWLPQPLPGHGVIPIPSSASLKSVPKSEPTYDELRPTYSSSPPVEDIVRSDHQNPPRIPSVLCNPSPDRKAPPPPIPDRQQSDDSKLRPRLKVKPNLPPSMAGNITPARPESMSRSRQMTSSSSSSSSSSTSLSTSLSTSTPPIPATTSLPESLWAWIPEDISSLTVGAVGDCLHLLHLEPHVEQFESAQVDGALLQVLTHEELQQEFGLSSVEARKLYMFAQRGWRPKLDD